MTRKKIGKGSFAQTVKYLFLLAVLFLIPWTLFPLSMGINHPGITLLTAALVVLAAMLVFSKQIKSLKRGKLRLFVVVCEITAAVLAGAFFVLSVLMIAAALKTPAKNATVIVAGAQINGDTVSLMLGRRLDKAVEYLNENPGSPCIVTGGQGVNEIYSEAEVMKKYLLRAGIDENRIFMEDKAVNTEQNMRFSAEIIKENGLSDKVVIATDFFHQLRCAYEARKNSLTPFAASCSTVWYLFPGYWVREMLAICKAVFL